MEEVRRLCEAAAGEEEVNEHGLPPGFRFHPTDEELITFYLASKVFHGSFCGVQIAEIDLNRCEPWDLPDVAKMGEKEWYFFSLRDRKYPTGLRTNRATGAGYWKATGKDREVYSSSSGNSGGEVMTWNNNKMLLGMKKTLVFYKGRAPRGEKTKWVMHEYRLDGHFSYRSSSSSSSSAKEEWVICRIFRKTGEKKSGLFQLQGLEELAAASLHDYPHKDINNVPPAGCLPPLLEAACSSSWEFCHQNQAASTAFHNPPYFNAAPLLLPHNDDDEDAHHVVAAAADLNGDEEDDDLKTILNQSVNMKNNNVVSDPVTQTFTSASALQHSNVLKHCKKEDASDQISSAYHFDFRLPGMKWGCSQDNRMMSGSLHNSYYPNPLLSSNYFDSQENNSNSNHGLQASASGGFHMMLDAASAPTVRSCVGIGGDTWSSLMGHTWPGHPLN